MDAESNLRSVYDERGYATVKNVIPPEVAAVFLSITQKAMGDGRDAQARFAASMKQLSKPAYDIYSYDYPAALTFLWALTPFVQSAIGKSLLPTYSYFRVYQKGGLCMVHSDRPSCEHSMSLALGTSDGRNWPFAIGQRRPADRVPGCRAGLDRGRGKGHGAPVQGMGFAGRMNGVDGLGVLRQAQAAS